MRVAERLNLANVNACGFSTARPSEVCLEKQGILGFSGAERRLVVVIIIVVVVVVRAPLRPVDVLDELAAVRRAPERVGPLRK